MNDFFSLFFIGTAGLILFATVIRQPYMGIVFMASMMPLEMFAVLPGALKGVTSLTSLFGLAAFIFSFINNRRFVADAKTSDKYIYLCAALLFVTIMFGEIFKPASTGITYPLTYIQLFSLVWLCEQIFKTPAQLETLMKFFIASNILAALASIFNFSAVSNSEGDLSRLSGLQGNANEFAVYLSLAIILIFYFMMTASSKGRRLVLIIIVGGLIFPLLLSGSRGAVLFVIPIFAWLLLQFRKNNFIFVVFILIVVVIAMGISGPYLPAGYLQRISNIPQDIIYSNDTVGLREGLWSYGIKLWSEQPVMGIGSGMFRVQSIYSPILYGTRMLPLHNTYLTHLVENGVLGLLFFLLIVVRSSINYAHVIRSTGGNSSLKILAITWQSAMLYILLNGIKGDWNVNKFLWISFAVSMIVVSLQKNAVHTKVEPKPVKTLYLHRPYRIVR